MTPATTGAPLNGENGNGNGNGEAPRKVSEIVAALCAGDPEDRITLHDLIHAFGLRAFGLAILVFALPNGIPAPIAPGLSAVLGAPLVLLAAQMLFGLDHPWFPESWGERSFRRAEVAKLLRPALPVLERIERYVKPRYAHLTSRRARPLLGAVVLWNALLLSLPIPFGNLLPAWAIILAAFGQIERDGTLVIASLAASVVATGWVWFLLDVGLVVLEKIFA